MSPPIESTGPAPTTFAGRVQHFVMGPPAAATMAGLLEVLCFHPFDTTAKRLMSNESRVVDLRDPVGTARRVRNVVLPTAPGAAPATGLAAVRQLYSGAKWALMYKVSQRIVKFAGQPLLKDAIVRRGADQRFYDVFGRKRGRVMLESTAGAVVGACEIVLLPFDRMKVLSQTNKGALAQHSTLASVVRTQGLGTLYAGASTTVARNVPGSFALFFGTAATKDVVFGLDGDYRRATFFQNTVSSSVGAALGVFITSPMDVIKTRIQNKNFGTKLSGWQVFRTVCATEGFSAFYKGITPKIITTSPKLVFSYTLTEYFTGILRRANASNSKQ